MNKKETVIPPAGTAKKSETENASDAGKKNAQAPKEENIHKGHRDRQKKKYWLQGLRSFTDIEALELLLYFSIPRQDTNSIAHHLLTRFKDLRGVLDAEVHELCTVEGIGDNSAILLSLVGELVHRYRNTGKPKRPSLRGIEEIGEYLLDYFEGRCVETAVLLCLDARNSLISLQELGEGTLVSVEAPLRKIVDLLLQEKAVRAVISHNHVDGIALPSREDVTTTRQLFYAMKMIQVELLDHIIVANEDFISMRDSGFFNSF